MIQLPNTLSVYLGKQFLKNTAIIFGVLMTIVFLADFIEALRRGGDRDDMTIGILLPFIALFGAMLTFFRLAKTSELAVIRATGVSIWQFLFPALSIAFAFGILVLTVINPIAAAMQAENDRMEAKYFERQSNLLTLSTNDLWLRQVDEDGLSVIHARGVVNQGIDLTDVIIFQYDRGDIFTGRLDADKARLRPGYWDLENVVITGPNRPAERRERLEVPTSLTLLQIQESFASPATLSFWDLPSFIATLEKAGFSGDRHRLYFYSLIAGPILLLAMVLVAATFSLRSLRQGRTVMMVLGGIVTGFVFYFMTDIIYALGLAGNLPVLLAAFIPAAAITLFGLAMMFHLEDG